MYGLSFRLWRVLYRTVHLKPHSGMPQGKPANTRCVQLLTQPVHDLWLAFTPEGVLRLQPGAEMCGSTRQQAITYLLELKRSPRLKRP